jgi:hypothetical protein
MGFLKRLSLFRRSTDMASSKFDITEELTIIGLAAIALCTIYYTDNTAIPLAIGSGLIGYLKGMKSNGSN